MYKKTEGASGGIYLLTAYFQYLLLHRPLYILLFSYSNNTLFAFLGTFPYFLNLALFYFTSCYI